MLVRGRAASAQGAKEFCEWVGVAAVLVSMQHGSNVERLSRHTRQWQGKAAVFTLTRAA